MQKKNHAKEKRKDPRKMPKGRPKRRPIDKQRAKYVKPLMTALSLIVT